MLVVCFQGGLLALCAGLSVILKMLLRQKFRLTVQVLIRNTGCCQMVASLTVVGKYIANQEVLEGFGSGSRRVPTEQLL